MGKEQDWCAGIKVSGVDIVKCALLRDIPVSTLRRWFCVWVVDNWGDIDVYGTKPM